jgi:hypothetical protein
MLLGSDSTLEKHFVMLHSRHQAKGDDFCHYVEIDWMRRIEKNGVDQCFEWLNVVRPSAITQDHQVQSLDIIIDMEHGQGMSISVDNIDCANADVFGYFEAIFDEEIAE